MNVSERRSTIRYTLRGTSLLRIISASAYIETQSCEPNQRQDFHFRCTICFHSPIHHISEFRLQKYIKKCTHAIMCVEN